MYLIDIIQDLGDFFLFLSSKSDRLRDPRYIEKQTFSDLESEFAQFRVYHKSNRSYLKVRKTIVEHAGELQVRQGLEYGPIDLETKFSYGRIHGIEIRMEDNYDIESDFLKNRLKQSKMNLTYGFEYRTKKLQTKERAPRPLSIHHPLDKLHSSLHSGEIFVQTGWGQKWLKTL